MTNMGLTQLITDPTRVTPHSSTTIDLIFTYSDFGVIYLSMSDHFCNRTFKRPRPKPKVIKVHCFKSFDQSTCITDLESQPWDTIYLFDSPDDASFCHSAD